MLVVLDQCRTALRRLKRNQVKITLNGWGLKDLGITYFNKCAVNKSLKDEIKAIDKAYKTME